MSDKDKNNKVKLLIDECNIAFSKTDEFNRKDAELEQDFQHKYFILLNYILSLEGCIEAAKQSKNSKIKTEALPGQNRDRSADGDPGAGDIANWFTKAPTHFPRLRDDQAESEYYSKLREELAEAPSAMQKKWPTPYAPPDSKAAISPTDIPPPDFNYYDDADFSNIKKK